MHSHKSLLLDRLAVGAFLIAGASPASASILADVIGRIEQMGVAPLISVMANVAENSPDMQMASRLLTVGDRVIVGYGAGGAAVYGTASATGVVITPELAATMATGLAAGVYPVGSALYSLPPAGQLSLLEEAQDGTALSAAQALALSRIDGSITTLISARLYPDLVADVAALSLDPALYTNQVDSALLAATALGAVNTGEILTRINVEWNSNLTDPDIQISSALINTGASISLVQGKTTDAVAYSMNANYLNDPLEGKALVLNMAANNSEVLARIQTQIEGVSFSVGEAVTTAIGAVNAGAVGQK